MTLKEFTKRQLTQRSPTAFSAELVRTICERIAQGETWYAICREDGMPGYSTLYGWRRRFPEVDEMVCQAKEIAGDARFEAMMELVEEGAPGAAADRRLTFDILKHQSERLAPGHYGKGAETPEARTYFGTVYAQDPVTGEVTAGGQ